MFGKTHEQKASKHAAAAMHEAKYPWLTKGARSALAFIFTFTWK